MANNKVWLGIIAIIKLYILGFAPCSLYAQDAIIETASEYINNDNEDQLVHSKQNRTFFFLPPLLLIGSIGNTSFYFSPGIGFDYLNGLNLGFDIKIDQQIKNLNLAAGFGAGLNFLAVGGYASYKGNGAGYYLTFYGNTAGPDGQSNNQIVGGLIIFGKNFSLRLENDFLFKGDKYDRWRTTAFEIGIGNFVVGTFLYTNMPDKGNENYKFDENYTGSMWKGNRKAYSDGEVYSSVFYVGFRYRNRIIRIGVNHPIVQDITQNGWHAIIKKPFFHTPYGQYFSPYIYIGYYNPFSLYGK